MVIMGTLSLIALRTWSREVNNRQRGPHEPLILANFLRNMLAFYSNIIQSSFQLTFYLHIRKNC